MSGSIDGVTMLVEKCLFDDHVTESSSSACGGSNLPLCGVSPAFHQEVFDDELARSRTHNSDMFFKQIIYQRCLSCNEAGAAFCASPQDGVIIVEGRGSKIKGDSLTMTTIVTC